MAELKFIELGTEKKDSDCCRPAEGVSRGGSYTDLPSVQEGNRPTWITGTVETAGGKIPIISTELTRRDYWEHVKCRASAFRNNYAVAPGLYAVGAPGKNSEVFVSSNYKFSFDLLRKELKGFDAWVLVLDTGGINVWCAAGKGTFGTGELVRRISAVELDKVVDHRRIIVPQLGAPGISAHLVRKASGFKVSYGPVRARDIGAYVAGGYRATKEMRTVKFPLLDRLVLTPMEINPAMKKYYPWYALAVLVIFGLQPGGILLRVALAGAFPFLVLGIVAILAGALVTPVFLPLIPFRSFAVKGWLTGILLTVFFEQFIGIARHPDSALIRVFIYLFFPMASSFIALQFTGSTTFTGMSGVKRELRISLPLYAAGIALSVVLLAAYKLGEWRLI